MKLDIGFDLDGVVLDYIGWLEKFLKSREINIIKPRDRFHFDTEPNIKFRELERLIYKAMKYPDSIPEHPGAGLTLKRLHELTGDPIRITTARPDFVAVETLDVIRRILPDTPFSLSFVSSGTEKWKHIRSHCYIDDRRRTCIDLANRGYTVFMPERDYNMPVEDKRQIPIPIWNIEGFDKPYIYDVSNMKVTGRIITINTISDLLRPCFRNLIFS